MQRVFLKLILIICLLPDYQHAKAINWEQQSERLLQISGTLLEGAPVNDISKRKFGLGLVFDISFLPKLNTTIGSKTEKVPNSPVHTVPTMVFSLGRNLSSSTLFSTKIRLGYLMPGAESLLGVKAKLTQWTLGGSVGFLNKVSESVQLKLDLGAHLSNARVVGSITSPDSNDQFSSQAFLVFLSPGILFSDLGIWSNLQIGKKTTESKLIIPSDQTTLATKDTLSASAGFPFYLQPDIGYTQEELGLSVGFGYLYQSARAHFPKLHVGWCYDFKPTAKDKSETTKEMDKKSERNSRESARKRNRRQQGREQ